MTATYAGDANHFASSDSATITIDKATVHDVATGGSFTYDGTTHTGGSAVVSGDGVIMPARRAVLQGDQVNAGSYTVTATYAGDANHTGSSDSADHHHRQGDLDDGGDRRQLHLRRHTHTGGSAVVSGDGVITPTRPSDLHGDQVNAGSYTVTATYAGDANHTGSTDAPRSPSTRRLGHHGHRRQFTYDGTTHTGGSAVVSGAGCR